MTPRPSTLPGINKVITRTFIRLVMFVVVIPAFVLTLVGGYLIRGYANEVTQIAAQTISYSVEPAMVFQDRRGVAEAIQSVGSMETVRRIDVVDLQGNEVARWERSETGPIHRVSLAIDRVFLSRPRTQSILHAGTRIGIVRLYGSSGALFGYLATGVAICISSLGISLVAMRIMARQLQRDISQPLEDLASVADAVRNDRAFHRRAQPASIAEIDSFSRDFNDLMEELEGWHGQLTARNQELAHRAEHDPLTGLGNRDRFQRLLAETLVMAQTQDLRFSMLFLDLDKFKGINDTYGHQAGDHVLIEVARRLLACVRGSDHVFRLGGDEFAIILDPTSEGGSAAQLIGRIDDIMATPLLWDDETLLSIEMSIGFAIYPEHGRLAKDLVSHADDKMYLSKRGVVAL